MNTTPRGATSAPLTAPSASVNASVATWGAWPSPGTGSVALEKARFLHHQAVFARRLRQVAGVLDARLQLLRLAW